MTITVETTTTEIVVNVQAPEGVDGDTGWSPILAVVTDSARRVLQVVDWTGGTGTKPATGSYIGATGLTGVLASAVDIRAYGVNSTALDGLSGAADRGAYFTGSGAMSLFTFTAAGRALVDDADNTAQRATLGLVIGTDVLGMGGGTLTGALTLSADPTSALHAATKQYVDNLVVGLSVKAPVAVATTANITLSGEQTIDGVLTSASRVLVKDQSTGSQNGIYVSAAGAWTRAVDMDAWTEVPGANVWVEQGTANADTAWVSTNDPGGTLGSTSITWVKFGGSGAFQAANANLTAISGLSTAADKMAYWTGSGTAALTDLTAFSRTLFDDVDGAAWRTTLGLGTAAVAATGTSGHTVPFLDGDNTFSGRFGASQGVRLTGSITPTALSADTNDWAPTGHATSFIINAAASGASRHLTGLSASGVSDGDIRGIRNSDLSGYYIYLDYESASSSAANRFKMPAQLTLVPGSVIFFQYDGTASRWVPIWSGGLPMQVAANGTDISNTTTFRASIALSYLEATQTYNPASIANNAAGATQTITVTGAAMGALVDASFSIDLQGLDIVAWVSAVNTVSYKFVNNTGGSLDLGSGTVRVRVWT